MITVILVMATLFALGYALGAWVAKCVYKDNDDE